MTIRKKRLNKFSAKADSGFKTCFVTKTVENRDLMMRFVLGPDKNIVPDITGKLPGRGLWLVADPIIVQKAIDKKLFFKASKKSYTKVPTDLVAQITCLLKVHVLSLLGLARKAGQVVSGFEKVKEALSTHQAAVVFEALDVSENSKGKLYRPQDKMPIISVFDSTELGSVFGVPETMFIALLNGKMTDKIKPFIIKLNAFHAYKKKKKK